MELDRFHDWLRQLTEWAAAAPDVIGLVAVGSTSDTTHAPDRFSDHDLFVVTTEGAAAGRRDDLGWLPEPARIVLVHVETEHGRGVVYDDGHLVELAVFDDRELELARVNASRVLVGGDALAHRLAAIAERTSATRVASDPDGSHRFDSFVVQVVTGAGRYARGERLSANHRLRGIALTALLDLLAEHVPSEAPAQLDDLDPHRRFEEAYPALGRRIDAALLRPVPELAAELVDIAEEHLTGRLAGADAGVFAALRTAIARASR